MPENLDRYILMDGTLSGADWNDTNPNTRKYIYDKPDKIYEPIQNLKNIKDDIEINPNNGNVIKATLIGNTNITMLPNELENKSRSITLILKNIGSYNLSFSDNVRWSGNVIPDFSVYSTGVITLIANDDEVWYGNIGESYNDFTPIPPSPRDWDWSKHTSDPTYTVVDGRQFARHPSGMGTVMSFNDGTDRNVLVLDAQYRKLNGYAYYTDYNTDLNALLDDDKKLNLCQQYGPAFGDYVEELPFTGMSDADINTNYSTICNQDTKGSKYNTDSLVSLGANAQAANYCRSILVNGEGCDLPNINTLIRIYASMIQLDSMDPTKGSYPNLMLSNWFVNYFCWSSSWYGDNWGDCCAVSLGFDGRCSYSGQDNDHLGVAPCLELI